MPSLTHEALLLLFRHRPELAPELLQDALHVTLPRYSAVSVESADLTDVEPAEYRADLVILLLYGKPAFAIIVEVQLQRDERKLLSWPVYVASVRARYKCPACLLVVAPNDFVAMWAEAPIELGPGSFVVPYVLGPSEVPVVTDADRAKRDPELAVLSVMAHGKGDPDTASSIATAALEGVAGMRDDRKVLYLDLVLHSLGAATRMALEALMFQGKYEYQSDFARKYFFEGKAEGETSGKAIGVLHVLRARGITLTEAQRQRISSCTDVTVVDRWLELSVTVASAEQLFDA